MCQLAVHPHVKNALVIGAGGGVIRELTRIQNIERIDMVKLIPMVVKVCQEYFPQTAGNGSMIRAFHIFLCRRVAVFPELQ